MDIRHFKIYQAVCRQMSITKAAEELYMTQPAVSLAIKEMEQYYNCQLFERINRRLKLTESGRLLKDYGDNILLLFKQSRDELQKEELYQNCQLGINLTICETVYPAFERALLQEYPNLQLKTVVLNNNELHRGLLNNNLDLIISDNEKGDETMASLFLYTEEMRAYCQRDYLSQRILSKEEIVRYPFLLREKGSGIRECVDRYFTDYNCIFESSSTLSLIKMAKEKNGIVFLPSALGDDLEELNISGLTLLRNYYLLYRHNKILSLGMKKVIDFSLAYFQ